MGVMSRRVVPACGNLCFFCPSMRASSRQPVKRYKKLLSEIFPRSQDAEPNDRKIGKLCEYASRNPLRIPKITDYLGQRFYKDLRIEQFGSVKVVLLIYKKLLSSCKEQMPLFASSLLGIIRTLLEQTQQVEMQTLGCSTLVDFINNQTDSTHMFNLEGLIPKLCQLSREFGDDERALCLRAGGMQTLAVFVRFMGEHSHISMDFDHIISVTLENYVDFTINSENVKQDCNNSQFLEQKVQGVLKTENDDSSSPDISKNISSISKLFSAKTELISVTETAKSPSYWSRVCLHNIAKLAKEATTVRRVLEPLFHCFDTENYWLPEKGLACSVLIYLQSLLEESGDKSHLLLSILVKHLGHKNVVKQLDMQVNIVNIAAQLARNANLKSSVSITGAITDLIKLLRKCIQCSAEASSPKDGLDKWNPNLQSALGNCIGQLSDKVADVGPILDVMAVVLENIPTGIVGARATVSAVYRTAQIISSVPNVSYRKKVFPDALFHHLLLAMAHPDHEARVGAHRIFSTVLMPSFSNPWSVNNGNLAQTPNCGTLQALKKVNTGSFSIDDESNYESNAGIEERREEQSQSYSFKGATADGKNETTSLRLSSHQVSLLLSSIWVQAMLIGNTPENFEAMARTFHIALLFTQSKNSSHMALVQCFQLAFSLRSISLEKGGLPPSQRRSLFTLASYMLIFSARVGNLLDLIPFVESSLTEETVDPYLKLVEDFKLQNLSVGPEAKGYGSQEDEVAALRSLSYIELSDQQLKEILISHYMTEYGKLSEDELSNIKEQLLQRFSPDNAYPLGPPLFMDTPRPCSPLAHMEFQDLDEAMAIVALTDDGSFPDGGSQSGRKTSLSINSLDILSVNQLVESVLETARQVASLPVSSKPIPYDQVKNECEALVTGKQQKMSVLQSFKLQQAASGIPFSGENGWKDSVQPNMALALVEDVKLTNINPIQKQNQFSCSQECVQQQSFRLPPSSPYDKFLKAAGC
ncbi:unnamed protein product [Fraxinus pennsylvanica]|uniref:ARM repeat superfamily protein n=1 Tax=Fraxinus pennsylvanica TaxID=56036 RepID=A0AAD1ZWK8_9LAMI|nr:unnamed protein product [Fraxinus pennsylvanica]